MANLGEANVLITGTVRQVDVTTIKGHDYADVLVLNDGGCSVLGFKDAPKLPHVGETLSAVCYPYVSYGVSQKTGKPYAFLRFNFVAAETPSAA
ncbi:hypothetical protein [Pseudoscardovia suis]